MKRIYSGILFCLTMLLCIGCFLFSKQIFNGVSMGISICLSTLIPSMFSFMVLSDFISNSSLNQVLSRPFRLISRRLFKLDSSLFPIFLMSILGGYPIGAKLIAQKVRQGVITRETGQYLLSFCVNCSPAYLISGVSLVLWKNLSIGVMIYTTQVLAAITIALIRGFGKPVQGLCTGTARSREKNSILFVNAVNHSTKSMGVVCSFVVIFCGLFAFVDLIPMPQQAGMILKGLLEVTSGCQMIQNVSLVESILLISLFTSFGGVCVLLQLTALLSGTGLKILPFLFWRLAYTAFAVLFTNLGIALMKPVTPCFQQAASIRWQGYSVSPISSLFLLILGIMLLLFYRKSDKIELTKVRKG